MLEIFALASCFYFPAHPSWDICKTMGRDYTFQTAEQCEQQLQRHPESREDDRIVKFVCVKKSVAAWQPVN